VHVIERMFNILFIDSTAMMSGSEFSLMGLIENLDKRRFNPILLLPEEGPFYKKAKEMSIETIILPCMIRFGEGYRFNKIPKILTSLHKLVRIIKQKGIHLVHSNSPRASYLGGMAARLASIPSVTHVRDIHQSPFSHPFKARLLGYLADTVVAVSSATKDSISGAIPSLESKIEVIYNGIDIQEFDDRDPKDIRQEFGISKRAPVIGSVGIIHPVKGHDILIRATVLIKKHFPSVKVFIVGGALFEKDRVFRLELDKLVEDFGLDKNIVFTGFREDVFDFIQAMDVLVHPATYPDPFPRILLEASALKKAIVATRVGGVPEILAHDVSGLLVEPGDPESLAEAVISLLRDRKKAEEFALKARQAVEKSFTIEKHVSNMTAIYERLFGTVA